MKIEKIMTKDAGFCQENESLAKAAEIMWRKDCGIVPVLNKEEKLIGIITDRDICIAVSSQNRLASEILASEIINRKVISCSKKDKIEKVLKKMSKHQIRRLPVTKKNGKLIGIISITDILLLKKSLKKKTLKTLEAISKPAPILFKATD